MSSYTKVFTQLYDMIIWYGMVRYDNNMIWDMGLGCGGPSKRKLVLWIAQSDLENVTFFFGDIYSSR